MSVRDDRSAAGAALAILVGFAAAMKYSAGVGLVAGLVAGIFGAFIFPWLSAKMGDK